jgi:predicted transcriptional regulator
VQVRRPHGGLETAILDVLASANAPMTTADVREALGESLAYTTVLTVLSRLAEKGQVGRERRGRAHVYSAVTSQAEVTAARMHKLLDADDDRAAVLARFVGELSEADEEMLLAMLRMTRRDSG